MSPLVLGNGFASPLPTAPPPPPPDPCADPLVAYVGWGDTFCYGGTGDFDATADYAELYSVFWGDDHTLDTVNTLDGHPTLVGSHAPEPTASSPPGWKTERADGSPIGANVLTVLIVQHSADFDVVEGIINPAADGGGHIVAGVVHDDGVEVNIQIASDGAETVRLWNSGLTYYGTVLGTRDLLCNGQWMVVALHVDGTTATAYVYPYGGAVTAVGSLVSEASNAVLSVEPGQTHYAWQDSTGTVRIGYHRIVVDPADVPAILAQLVPNGL